MNAQNLFNRQGWNAPNLNPTSTQFGMITTPSGMAMRFITFVAKYHVLKVDGRVTPRHSHRADQAGATAGAWFTVSVNACVALPTVLVAVKEIGVYRACLAAGMPLGVLGAVAVVH